VFEFCLPKSSQPPDFEFKLMKSISTTHIIFRVDKLIRFHIICDLIVIWDIRTMTHNKNKLKVEPADFIAQIPDPLAHSL